MDLKIQSFAKTDLDRVFGMDSEGDTPAERARTSQKKYVRGQVQLVEDNARAGGWKLSASEALRSYGWPALLEVAHEGSFTLVSNPHEPSATLRSARRNLKLSVQGLAKSAGVSTEVIEQAEKAGTLSPIANLIKIAQPLALDAALLSFEAGAGGDGELGVRLRDAVWQTDTAKFSSSAVLGLLETGRVIYEQAKLLKALDYDLHPLASPTYPKDHNYGNPSYRQGFRLAENTRKLLSLGDAPIESVRSLIEEQLQIPLVQQELDARFAGATLSVAGNRGIVVNVAGRNQNVWIRRMTLCHELGHLLWDPEQRLAKLKVDEYRNIEEDSMRSNLDEVEARANAFAVAFLAPPDAVAEIVHHSEDTGRAIANVAQTFGISITASRYHINNVCHINTKGSQVDKSVEPSHEWMAAENFTIDWFPIRSTPISRVGKFAWLVALAVDKKEISLETASYYLKSSAQEVEKYIHTIIDLWVTEHM